MWLLTLERDDIRSAWRRGWGELEVRKTEVSKVGIAI